VLHGLRNIDGGQQGMGRERRDDVSCVRGERARAMPRARVSIGTTTVDVRSRHVQARHALNNRNQFDEEARVVVLRARVARSFSTAS